MSFNPMRPSDDEIIAALARMFDAPEAAVIAWLTQFCREFNPVTAANRLAERGGDRAAS